MRCDDRPQAPLRTEVADLTALLAAHGDGVHWTLTEAGQLNANLVHLDPGHGIAEHRNDEVDVLVVVVAGTGTIVVEGRTTRVHPLVVAHVPRGARREVVAGDEGVTYLTVHVRRGRLRVGERR